MANRKIFLIAVVGLIMLSLCNSCSDAECVDGYTEYKPVFGNNTGGPFSDLYVIDESRVDAGHYERIKLIFEFHKVDYRVIDGKVWVACDVWADKNFMMNMTLRAESAADFCKLVRRDLDNLKRDIYGNTTKMLEMCDSMGL